MRASFVDRLLARVDGEVAPIWISQIVTTAAPPPLDALRAAVAALVAEVDRLQLAWNGADWVPARRGAGEVEAAVVGVPPAPLPALAARLLASPVDLGRELPLRVTVAPPAGGGAGTLAIQLHHAIGDARALMFLNARLWQHLSGSLDEGTALGPARLGDRAALGAMLRRWTALAALRRPEHRVLARRGTALVRRPGDEIGAPMLRSLRVALPAEAPAERRSALFFGAVLAGIAGYGTQDPDAPVRLRIPVDLRRELGLGRSLENACSAVPVEISRAALERALAEPGALARLVPDALHGLLARGVHWATVLECLAVSRAASTRALRSHTRPELLAARRGSTMVTTYVGSVDRYFADAPFPIESVRTHTPTWGANALCFRGALVINVGAFDRLWSPDDLDRFVAAMQAWLGRAGAASEVQ